MKRNALFTALLLVLGLVVLGLAGCQKSAPDTNRDATVATNANTANEKIDTAAIELELKRIENDFPRVLRDKDANAVDQVEADDIVIIYPDGGVGSKTQDLTDIREGNMSADSWEVTDLQVKVLNKDSALVTGRSIIKGGKVKTPNGKTVDISGEYRFIDTFVRRNGQWKLVGSVTTPVQPGAMGATSPGAVPSPASTRTPEAKASPTAAKATATPTP